MRRPKRKYTGLIVVLAGFLAGFLFLLITPARGYLANSTVCQWNASNPSNQNCRDVTMYSSASYYFFCEGATIVWPPVSLDDYAPFGKCPTPTAVP